MNSESLGAGACAAHLKLIDSAGLRWLAWPLPIAISTIFIRKRARPPLSHPAHCGMAPPTPHPCPPWAIGWPCDS